MSEQSSNTQERQEREPTMRQVEAVAYMLANGSSKAESLRAVGYSEAVARQPHKVFNSPAVQGILERAGVDIDDVVRRLKNISERAGKVEFIMFPAYKNPEDFNPFEDGADEAPDDGSQLTDDDIRETIKAYGGAVAHIRHGKKGRQVVYFAPDTRNQLEAMEKIINIHGIYAPKRTDLKVSVGVFSSFRERMEKRRKEGKIIDIGEKRDATTPLEASENNETT